MLRDLQEADYVLSREIVLTFVLVKISVCPDVVTLRGVTNNGKLGGFFGSCNAFDCEKWRDSDHGDRVFYERVNSCSFARDRPLEERSSTCSLSIEKSSKRFNLLFCKGWVLCILGWHGSANAETAVQSNSSCSWFGFECNFTKVNKPIQINHGLGFSCLIRFPCYAGRLYRASWQWEIDVWCPEDSFSLIWWRVFFTAVENNIWCFPEDTVSRCVFTYICSFDVRVVLSLHCNCGSHRSQLCCF